MNKILETHKSQSGRDEETEQDHIYEEIEIVVENLPTRETNSSKHL